MMTPLLLNVCLETLSESVWLGCPQHGRVTQTQANSKARISKSPPYKLSRLKLLPMKPLKLRFIPAKPDIIEFLSWGSSEFKAKVESSVNQWIGKAGEAGFALRSLQASISVVFSSHPDIPQIITQLNERSSLKVTKRKLVGFAQWSGLRYC